MSYLNEWVALCVEQAMTPAQFYTGCRKIHTGMTAEFKGPLDDSLQIGDCGFTQSKLTMLRRLYWNDEHAEKVAALWAARQRKGRYGSVSVSTYHHITKSDPTKRSSRASVMGPCLVGVGFTLLNKTDVCVDAWYRTTELFKKFPADLVFIRDTVIPGIGVRPDKVVMLRCHFANVTSHPMYAVTWIPHLADPIAVLEQLKEKDRRFFDWVLKWTGRYICPEHHRGIAKFAQALRVQQDAYNRIKGEELETLRSYIRDNHPGYRNGYEEEIEDDDVE